MRSPRAFTPHVYDYAWHDDFAAARNYSFAKASGDYIMWLDADDVLSDEARAQLSAFKSASWIFANLTSS